MEELKKQIAVLLDKTYGSDRHRLRRIAEELPTMAAAEVSKVRKDVLLWQWEVGVKATIWQMVKEYCYQTGEMPRAIVVGGDIFGTLYNDVNDSLHDVDGSILWRGIRVISSTERTTAYLIGEAMAVPLPPCPM